MQDLDFFKQTHSSFQEPAPQLVPNQAKINKKNTPKQLGFGVTPILIVILLCFSFGILGGVFLTKQKDIENNLITRPDNTYYNKKSIVPSNEKPNYSNTDNNDNKGSQGFKNIAITNQEGRFLIKIGTYPMAKAQEITKWLEQLSVFQTSNVSNNNDSNAYKCKAIERPKLSKNLIFRLPVPKVPQQINVLVGCFLKEEIALKALKKVLETKIVEIQNAQLFHITE